MKFESPIPDTPDSNTANYWCTWWAQCHSAKSVVPRLDDGRPDKSVYDSQDVGRWARDSVKHEMLNGPEGWANSQHPESRSDLLFVIDDGWDVPSGLRAKDNRFRFGSLIPHPDRFPFADEANPTAALTTIQQSVVASGWQGLGLWVACQAVGERADQLLDAKALEAYWRERARCSAEAGIRYWKVDWGCRFEDVEFRQMLTHFAHEKSPGLLVEQANGGGPGVLNDIQVDPDTGAVKGSGRLLRNENHERACRLLACSDVFRTYDVTEGLTLTTTLERVTALLEDVQSNPDARALINCEDEAYLGAALGLALGVMRYEEWRPADAPDLLHPQPIDEVKRAVRWQRIAPPVGAGKLQADISGTRHTDTYMPEIYAQGIWPWPESPLPEPLYQSAPSIVSRGPIAITVDGDEPHPYVVGMLHPDGPLSIAALPRAKSGEGLLHLRSHAKVRIKDGSTPSRIGIFGNFASLTIEPFGFEGRLLAQDLAGGDITDISDRVHRQEKQIRIPGSLIEEIGLSHAQPDDPSQPACILFLDQ